MRSATRSKVHFGQAESDPAKDVSGHRRWGKGHLYRARVIYGLGAQVSGPASPLRLEGDPQEAATCPWRFCGENLCRGDWASITCFSKGFRGRLAALIRTATPSTYTCPRCLLRGRCEGGRQIAGGAARQASQTTSHLRKIGRFSLFRKPKPVIWRDFHADIQAWRDVALKHIGDYNAGEIPDF